MWELRLLQEPVVTLLVFLADIHVGQDTRFFIYFSSLPRNLSSSVIKEKGAMSLPDSGTNTCQLPVPGPPTMPWSGIFPGRLVPGAAPAILPTITLYLDRWLEFLNTTLGDLRHRNLVPNKRLYFRQ